jgi:hypothetical protein
MWKAFQRYRALDPEARAIFRRAVLLSTRIAISLRLRGFKRTKDALHAELPFASSQQFLPDRGVKDRVEKTCRMVKASTHYGIVRSSCLVESLTLWSMLQEQSILTTLRIGVRRGSQNFEAHAWVEYEGVALNQSEEPHQHYAAFDEAFSGLPGEKP